jgi:hypothetical protein
MRALLLLLLFLLCLVTSVAVDTKKKGSQSTAAFHAPKGGGNYMHKTMESTIISGPAQLASPDFGTNEFQFQNQCVRTVTIDGTAYFIAKDLAAVLGYRNPRQAVRSHVNRSDRITVHSLDGNRGNPYQLAVNESGVYALVFGSRKPEAQEFKHWVTSEVLPRLRKTGHYEMGTTPPSFWAEINQALRSRGAARGRQVSRIVAHRNGLFSVKIGTYWVHDLSALNVAGLPLSHALREGRALSAIREGPVKTLVQ